MQIIVIGAPGTPTRINGRDCSHCHRRLRLGQPTLYHRIPRAPWDCEEFAVHVACALAVLEATPPPDTIHDPDRYHTIRDLVLANGGLLTTR